MTFELLNGRPTELLDDFGRENTRSESSTEYGVKLVVQASHAHVLKVPVRVNDGMMNRFPGQGRTKA